LKKKILGFVTKNKVSKRNKYTFAKNKSDFKKNKFAIFVIHMFMAVHNDVILNAKGGNFSGAQPPRLPSATPSSLTRALHPSALFEKFSARPCVQRGR
jgi:hypothetical protein